MDHGGTRQHGGHQCEWARKVTLVFSISNRHEEFSFVKLFPSLAFNLLNHRFPDICAISLTTTSFFRNLVKLN
jgi:hypothetical protein